MLCIQHPITNLFLTCNFLAFFYRVDFCSKVLAVQAETPNKKAIFTVATRLSVRGFFSPSFLLVVELMSFPLICILSGMPVAAVVPLCAVT